VIATRWWEGAFGPKIVIVIVIVIEILRQYPTCADIAGKQLSFEVSTFR